MAEQTTPKSRAGRDATVAIADPDPPPPAVKRESGKRIRAIAVAAAIVILLLSLGICASALAKSPPSPALTLSPSTVVTGGTFGVTAVHLPANQIGEIRLQSQLHVFDFQAGAEGVVTMEITLTADVEAGRHQVSVCWSGTCHVHTTLLVVAPGSAPTPATSPTPPSSPSPGTTPRATPHSTPTGTPRSSPTATPTHGPTPSPKPTPKPTPTPPPTPPPTPVVTVPSISTLGGFTVTLQYFPSGTWTIYVVQGGSSISAGTMSSPCGSSGCSKHFPSPLGVLLGQSDYVKACQGSVCYRSANVTVGL